eukprot:TRINITY_DN21147_c0_g1_i1.p1 TRINITY_DN21147_c0_g1~~TRINITY_DN21147_c0_g1_i1.p1  ORF type:complete len:238 (+),score=64.07 TRINITY_DN21147_c0_g1_i1:47-715(+)
MRELLARASDPALGPAWVNQQREDGVTPLLMACHQRHEEMITMLLASGAQPNLTDKHGANAVYLAAQVGLPALIVSDLIAAGASVHQKTEKGICPIHIAVHNRRQEIASTLIAHGADVNAVIEEDGSTPLLIACWSRNEKMVGLLLGNGASVEARMKDGSSALFMAVEGGSTDVVKLILQSGHLDIFEKNSRGETAREMAHRLGKQDIIIELMCEESKSDQQ